MKKIIFIGIIIVFVFPVIFCETSYTTVTKKNDVCEEKSNKEMCQEYDDFLAFFFGERNWKVSVDFFEVPIYKIKRGVPKHDPLFDEFYE